MDSGPLQRGNLGNMADESPLKSSDVGMADGLPEKGSEVKMASERPLHSNPARLYDGWIDDAFKHVAQPHPFGLNRAWDIMRNLRNDPGLTLFQRAKVYLFHALYSTSDDPKSADYAQKVLDIVAILRHRGHNESEEDLQTLDIQAASKLQEIRMQEIRDAAAAGSGPVMLAAALEQIESRKAAVTVTGAGEPATALKGAALEAMDEMSEEMDLDEDEEMGIFVPPPELEKVKTFPSPLGKRKERPSSP